MSRRRSEYDRMAIKALQYEAQQKLKDAELNGETVTTAGEFVNSLLQNKDSSYLRYKSELYRYVANLLSIS